MVVNDLFLERYLSTSKMRLTQRCMLTAPQLRAARALLGWSRDVLAHHSDTAAETVQGFESRGSDPKRSTMLKWQRALEEAGVEFFDPTPDGKGEGVRFKTVEGRGRRA